MHLLREMPGRRVWREGNTVVKAFRHPSPWLRWRDAVRARRELALLGTLFERGLPVPRPLGFERRDGAACARIAWIADAPTLEERLAWSERVLRGTAERPVPRELVWARRRAWFEATGRTVARFCASGLHQPDWHPKNLLVDANDRLHVIDLHKARVGTPTAEVAREAARRTLSLVFERATPRELAHLARAWWDALPGAWRTQWAGPAQDAGADAPEHAPGARRRAWLRDLLEQARIERRDQVERDLDRWLRPSGIARVASQRAGTTAGASVDVLPDPAAGDAAPLAVFELRGTRATLRDAWLAQARICEHRIPAARPARLWLESRENQSVHAGSAWRAHFGVHATADPFAPADARDPLAMLAARLGPGAAAGRLLTRTAARTRRWTAPDGTVHLVPLAAQVANAD